MYGESFRIIPTWCIICPVTLSPGLFIHTSPLLSFSGPGELESAGHGSTKLEAQEG